MSPLETYITNNEREVICLLGDLRLRYVKIGSGVICEEYVNVCS